MAIAAGGQRVVPGWDRAHAPDIDPETLYPPIPRQIPRTHVVRRADYPAACARWPITTAILRSRRSG